MNPNFCASFEDRTPKIAEIGNVCAATCFVTEFLALVQVSPIWTTITTSGRNPVTCIANYVVAILYLEYWPVHHQTCVGRTPKHIAILGTFDWHTVRVD